MPAVNMTETGRNIITLRNRNNLTVREIQDVFGFATPQAIYKWQSGTTLPTIDNLVVLAAIFKVTINDIIVTDLV